MGPTTRLVAEHRVIEAVLDCLQRATRTASGETLDTASIRECLEFFRGFADGCHHHKEEHSLFPRLEIAGVSRRGGPIGAMIEEHEEGRRLVAEMSGALTRVESGDGEAARDLTAAALKYILLLEDHFSREDLTLFPMAEERLSEEEKQSLQREFDATDESEVGRREYSRLLELGRKLCHRWEVTFPVTSA